MSINLSWQNQKVSESVLVTVSSFKFFINVGCFDKAPETSCILNKTAKNERIENSSIRLLWDEFRVLN